ncbi:16S rRNA (uracil(1498)-N(3))-methyltransferase [Salinisphaera sp. USBA-960]|nr:16S rRNA (uracil(1498)-N(3))-methyltransferase [Salifodinibacter halophilus]NNC26463.1 16S rRNA (uracil(1498)-N(3))-methyltransferase [Salifodinibacter halophilus]
MAAHVPRIYLPQPLSVDDTFNLPDAKRHHLATVLRLAPGDRVTLFNDSSFEYDARIETATRKTLAVHVVDYAAPPRESVLEMTLVQSILGGDRMDYALAKAVELGVQRIQPVFADRGKIKLTGQRAAKKHDHWQAVVEAAAEQSGRLIRPAVAAPDKLATTLGWLASDRTGLVLAPTSTAPLATTAIAGAVDLLIGPESGLSQTEVKTAHEHGWHDTSLGPRTLRAETAGPAAISVLQAVAGDFADRAADAACESITGD